MSAGKCDGCGRPVPEGLAVGDPCMEGDCKGYFGAAVTPTSEAEKINIDAEAIRAIFFQSLILGEQSLAGPKLTGKPPKYVPGDAERDATLTRDERFERWAHDQPPLTWARYDLHGARMAWNAGRADLAREQRERLQASIAAGLVAVNPCPDAAAPAVPTGSYREGNL